MARLEYRWAKPEQNDPVLYAYDGISPEEISTRFVCDYFVKDHHVYEQLRCATGSGGVTAIFVREAEDEEAYNPEVVTQPDWKGIRLEVREFREKAAYYPVLQTLHLSRQSEVRLYLQANQVFLKGQVWVKTSAEIDEDRRVYVLYVESDKKGGSQ